MPWILGLECGREKLGKEGGKEGKEKEKGERLRSGNTGTERVYCNSTQELSKKAKFLDHMGGFP